MIGNESMQSNESPQNDTEGTPLSKVQELLKEHPGLKRAILGLSALAGSNYALAASQGVEALTASDENQEQYEQDVSINEAYDALSPEEMQTIDALRSNLLQVTQEAPPDPVYSSTTLMESINDGSGLEDIETSPIPNGGENMRFSTDTKLDTYEQQRGEENMLWEGYIDAFHVEYADNEIIPTGQEVTVTATSADLKEAQLLAMQQILDQHAPYIDIDSEKNLNREITQESFLNESRQKSEVHVHSFSTLDTQTTVDENGNVTGYTVSVRAQLGSPSDQPWTQEASTPNDEIQDTQVSNDEYQDLNIDPFGQQEDIQEAQLPVESIQEVTPDPIEEQFAANTDQDIEEKKIPPAEEIASIPNSTPPESLQEDSSATGDSNSSPVNPSNPIAS